MARVINTITVYPIDVSVSFWTVTVCVFLFIARSDATILY